MKFVRLGVIALCSVLVLVACGGGDSPPSEETRQTPTPGGKVDPTPDLHASLGENEDAMQQAMRLMEIVPGDPSSDCSVRVDETGVLEPEEFREALPCVVGQFPWPAGRYLNAERYFDIAFGSDEEEWLYPPDFRYTAVESMNDCAWWSVWLEAYDNGDSDTQQAAELIIVNVNPYRFEHLAGWPPDLLTAEGRAFYIDIAKAVQLNDATTIRNWYEGNCGWIDWDAITGVQPVWREEA